MSNKTQNNTKAIKNPLAFSLSGLRHNDFTYALLVFASFMALQTIQPAKAADYNFNGVVEPRQTVNVANEINGVIRRIYVTIGQRVKQGDLLVSLDRADAEISLASAEAALKEAEANLALAKDDADRKTKIVQRGAGAEAKAIRARLREKVAQAEHDGMRANLRAAKLTLDRTEIRAPIDGTIGKLYVTPGAFVEAEGGTVLLEIEQLDPIRVAYSVPYATRQKALAATATPSIKALLGRLSLKLRLAEDKTYSHNGRAIFESARLDANTGALTVWAEFPNPDRILVPGLKVGVQSSIMKRAKPGETK